MAPQPRGNEFRVRTVPIRPSNCIKWSADGRVVLVGTSEIIISKPFGRKKRAYMNKSEIEWNCTISLPKDLEDEMVPVTFPRDSLTTEALLSSTHAAEDEIDLATGAFLAVATGPRGTGPLNSSAIATLTSRFRVAIHHAPCNPSCYEYDEPVVLSERLYCYLEAENFFSTQTASKDRRRTADPVSDELKYSLLATQTISWSSGERESYIALCSPTLISVWKYDSLTMSVSQVPVGTLVLQNEDWLTASMWTEDQGHLIIGTVEAGIQVFQATMTSDAVDLQLMFKLSDAGTICPISFFEPMDSQCVLYAAGPCIFSLNLETQTGQLVAQHKQQVVGAFVRSSDHHVAVAYIDGQIQVWDWKSSTLVSEIRSKNDSSSQLSALHGVCLSPNGIMFASALIVDDQDMLDSMAFKIESLPKTEIEYSTTLNDSSGDFICERIRNIVLENYKRDTPVMIWDVVWLLYLDAMESFDREEEQESTVDVVLRSLAQLIEEKTNHPYFAQASYLVRSNLPVEVEMSLSPPIDSVANIIWEYWAEETLRKLFNGKSTPTLTELEQTSILLMADLLKTRNRASSLVELVYLHFVSNSDGRKPQAREKCPRCSQAIAWHPVAASCPDGHMYSRCSVSFQIIVEYSPYKCSGCNARTSLSGLNSAVFQNVELSSCCRFCRSHCLINAMI